MKPPYPLSALLLSILPLLALAVGCERTDSGGAGASSGGATGGASAPPAEVKLGYFANLTHAQAVLGVSSGEFASAIQPAKLTTKVFNAGPSLIEALFAGEVDLGYIGPSPVLSAHLKSKGQGVRVVSGAAANGVLIVASKNSGINSLADLKGKRVATPQHGNTQDVAARHYLLHELKQADVSNVIPVANAEQSALMDRGQIDAAWAPEPWGSRLIAEVGAKAIAEEKDIWPEKQFSLTVVITTPEFLAKHPDVVKQLLGVHVKWTARLQQEPAKYVPQLGDALFALTSKKLPAGVLDQAIGRVKFTNEPLEATFRTMGKWAYDLGFAPQEADLNGLFQTELLKQVQQSTGSSPTTAPATAATAAR